MRLQCLVQRRFWLPARVRHCAVSVLLEPSERELLALCGVATPPLSAAVDRPRQRLDPAVGDRSPRPKRSDRRDRRAACLTGTAGLAIVRAIVAGERDPRRLAGGCIGPRHRASLRRFRRRAGVLPRRQSSVRAAATAERTRGCTKNDGRRSLPGLLVHTVVLLAPLVADVDLQVVGRRATCSGLHQLSQAQEEDGPLGAAVVHEFHRLCPTGVREEHEGLRVLPA
jgi:hypothetical protein